jgi:lysophospholipase L1-like esterase
MSAFRRGLPLLGGAWIVLCGLAILGLVAELGLALQRRARLQQARSHAEANPFETAREVSGAFAQGLWLVPEQTYRPGARLELEVSGERYSIAINSRGFRTREFEERRPQGRRRVVCIGGSTTVQGRSNEETYPAILERLVHEARPDLRIEVLNLGVSGTGSRFWMRRLPDVLGLEPDLIVHYEFVNDFFWEGLPAHAARHPWSVAARRHSLLAGRLLPLDPADFERAFATTLRRALRMKRIAAQQGARYLSSSFAGPDATVAAPGFAAYLDANVEAWGGRHGLRRYAEYRRLLDAYNARQQAFAAASGLDSSPVASIVDPRLFVDLCHMNGAGIEALAEAFLPGVVAALDAGAARP